MNMCPRLTKRSLMSIDGFEIIDHTADWAMRVYGRDLKQLFVQAALGLSSLMVDRLDVIPISVERQSEFRAYDAEGLLVEWLSELAYWAEIEQIVFREFELSNMSPTRLSTLSRGGKVRELQRHIKAVTYHNLEIIETDAGLAVTVVFDV
jgi:SHS2 domain-containing protein